MGKLSVLSLHANSANCMTGIILFERTVVFYIFGLRSPCPKKSHLFLQVRINMCICL